MHLEYTSLKMFNVKQTYERLQKCWKLDWKQILKYVSETLTNNLFYQELINAYFWNTELHSQYTIATHNRTTQLEHINRKSQLERQHMLEHKSL